MEFTLNTSHIFTLLFATLSLSACNAANTRSPSEKPEEIVGATELISATMTEVKAGAALLDKLWINKKALVQETELLDQYAVKFAPAFKSIGDYQSLFKNHCASLQGDYRNFICWNEDRSQIHFVAESFITEYRSTYHRIFLNVVEAKPGVNMDTFTDSMVTLVQDMPTIKFAGRSLSRFNKLQQLETLYDDLALQIKSLPGFMGTSDYELLSAAKTVHDALSVSGKIKEQQVWQIGKKILGTVSVLEKYQDGNQNCADIKIFRKEGIGPSFAGDMKKIMSGDDGTDTGVNTLCTEMDDRDGLAWRFVS